MNKHKRFEDAEEVSQIFDTLSDKIPKMIKDIMDSFFSPEAATNIAKSVAVFRKTLIENGIPEEEAMDMTREYLQTVTNWQGMIKKTVE
ncbi:MAG: hypothetical protein ACLFVP_04760 [Candidatus Bathyarchaeia archaeon]